MITALFPLSTFTNSIFENWPSSWLLATLTATIGMCIMEHLEVLEYSGIFISNPVYRILCRNNCDLWSAMHRCTPPVIHLTHCFSWRHLLFPVVYFNCYRRNLELPITCIARSLVETIVVSFLPIETWKFSLEKTKHKKVTVCYATTDCTLQRRLRLIAYRLNA